VSQFQGDIDWVRVYADGRVFAFIRASHGSLQDTKFLANMPAAENAGVLAGAYHYAVPVYDPNYGLPGADPETEAARFLTQARDFITVGYLRPMLDLELGGGQVPVGAANLADWAEDWIESVERQTGVEAMVYCNSNYARNYLYSPNSNLATRTLVFADWMDYPADPNTTNPEHGTGIWPTWTFWQYSNMGNTAGWPSVDGIGTRVDLDAFKGTLAQLQSHLIYRWAVITVSPTSLSQTIRQRRSAAAQTFTVRNSGIRGLVYRLYSNRSWLSVDPPTGFCKSETDTITVNCSTADLPVGTHTATITIAGDLANNSPQTVAVTLTVQPIPGDLNHDGNIDGSDINLFAACLTGHGGGPLPSDCVEANLDMQDEDVDQADFAILQRCLSGVGIPADPDCAP